MLRHLHGDVTMIANRIAGRLVVILGYGSYGIDGGYGDLSDGAGTYPQSTGAGTDDDGADVVVMDPGVGCTSCYGSRATLL